ncbi:MAG: protein jag [Oscillospiraceae bacterium]|nr:protein jag [Oscillospiraceae bacterium]
MIKSIEATGRTKDDAIESALKTLGLSIDDVSLEILDMGKTGFLGFGAVPARVRVSYEAPGEEPQPEPVPEPEKKPEPKREKPEKKAEKKPEKKAEKPEPAKAQVSAPAEGEKNDKTAEVETFLAGLFERMNVEAEAKAVYDPAEKTVSVELVGARVGALIGRRGETLDAIQHLTNYVINNGENERIRVNVDAENYRAKRVDALSGLARKTAAKVVKYRRNMTLEPMNAYERHVIHTALQGFNGVTTYSTGTEPNRRVVVAYDRTQRAEPEAERPRSQKERPARSSAPRPQPEVPEAPAQPSKDKITREWC